MKHLPPDKHFIEAGEARQAVVAELPGPQMGGWKWEINGGNTLHADQLAVRLRDIEVLRLKLQEGMTFTQIAEKLGYASKSGAQQAYQRALHATVEAPRHDLRALAMQRNEKLIEEFFPKILQEGLDFEDRLKAWDRFLKTQAQQAELGGYLQQPAVNEEDRARADKQRAEQEESNRAWAEQQLADVRAGLRDELGRDAVDSEVWAFIEDAGPDVAAAIRERLGQSVTEAPLVM